jgi:hypothetical protein
VPNNVNFQVPFLGGGPTIAEQIMQGLKEGFDQKAQTQQLGIQQQNADTNKQRATSEAGLQGAQTEEIQQNIRRQKMMLDSLFTPKPDAQAGPSVSGTPTLGTAAPPPRTDFERLVDQSNLSDPLKQTTKLVGQFAVQTGKPEAAMDFFFKQLDKESKNVVPHVLFDKGLPYGVVNKFGEVHDLEDPAIPPDLQGLADSAKKIYAQKNLLLPDEITNTNSQNGRLWNVLHPGTPLPADLTLPQSATKDQAARNDAHLKSLLAAESTKAQRDAVNAARDAGRSDREAQQGITTVIGTEPKTGKDVLVSEADAKTMGLTGIMKAEADQVNKAQSARHWIPLAAKTADIQRADPNDPKSAAANPEDMGILQLVDDLDKRGKLGVVASRWNDFLAGNVGSGDPEVEALRTKMGLSNTLLMNAHVGSRGGSYMMEHFENLANAGKMDANTLRAGVRSELDYIKDRAMLPSGRGTVSSPARSSGLSPDNPFAPKKVQ